MENAGGSTPDFLLAKYLVRCLETFHGFVADRDTRYGVELRPGAPRGVKKETSNNTRVNFVWSGKEWTAEPVDPPAPVPWHPPQVPPPVQSAHPGSPRTWLAGQGVDPASMQKGMLFQPRGWTDADPIPAIYPIELLEAPYEWRVNIRTPQGDVQTRRVPWDLVLAKDFVEGVEAPVPEPTAPDPNKRVTFSCDGRQIRVDASDPTPTATPEPPAPEHPAPPAPRTWLAGSHPRPEDVQVGMVFWPSSEFLRYLVRVEEVDAAADSVKIQMTHQPPQMSGLRHLLDHHVLAQDFVEPANTP